MERHRLDLVSLLAGLVLTGVGLGELFGDVDPGDLRLAWPVALLVIGLLVLVSVVRGSRGQ